MDAALEVINELFPNFILSQGDSLLSDPGFQRSITRLFNLEYSSGVEMVKALLPGAEEPGKKINSTIHRQVASALRNKNTVFLSDSVSQNYDAVIVHLLEFWLRAVFYSTEEWYRYYTCVGVVDTVIRASYSVHRSSYVRQVLLEEHGKFLARTDEARRKPKSTFCEFASQDLHGLVETYFLFFSFSFLLLPFLRCEQPT